MRKLLIAAVLAASFGGFAAAQSSDGATLTLSASGPASLIHEGAQWRCEGAVCRAAKVKGVPPLRACRRMAADLGAISAFTWRGKTLDEAELKACNEAART